VSWNANVTQLRRQHRGFTAVITDHGTTVRITQEWFDDAGSPLAA